MELIKIAELFAKRSHSGMMRKDDITPQSKHLEDVVSRMKSIGIVDEELLCAGWLHDIIEDTNIDFDYLFEKFGTRIATLVLSLSKNTSLPRKQREQAYIKQLRDACNDAKLVKLCDISANLGTLKNYDASRSKKIRVAKQLRRYLVAIKDGVIENKEYPKAITLLESINKSLKQWGQKAIQLRPKI